MFGAPDRRRGFLVGVVLLALAAITRFWDLNSPTDSGTPIFDEKHYVPQAWQVLTGGNWIEDNPAYGLVVHPPVGKWMIAGGEWLFGYTPLGWRFASAVVGTLMVVIIYRMTRRLTRSTLLGTVAGLFAICDGVLFVQSRMGMLDIFQAFWVVGALAALIADRDQMRERMHRAFVDGRIDDSPFGPRLGFRWWRFAAAVMLGLACGTKWSGIYFVLFFLVLSLGLDVANRTTYRVRRPWVGTLVRDVVPAGFSLAVLPVLIYLATFAPWFSSETSVYRFEVGDKIGTGGTWSWLPDAWRSLWYYEAGVLKFHETLTNSAGNHHPWESKPWTWPMSLRPMLYAVSNGTDKCDGQQCVRVQMLIGSPAMWWLAVPMLLWGLWSWLVRRDWRYAVVVVAYGASFLPWFTNLDRQMYFFYATAMAPFLIMGLALCVGDVLGMGRRRHASLRAPRGPEGRRLGIVLAAIYVGLVIANFVWLWPILTAQPISATHWNMEIWLPSWR
ncbi:Dolichyl-phosphate-mannose-protein mannosyltransferase [Williamsia sterculiae]|uniref:Polyprenol-phosphate-mannose--protein mannosyltransferase n=1 Tax=Williamsia sterculiae TaxID=1344003 RepID=A0A1N7DMZ7_9NOCA|nr:Dolichyl-phosphate-mannose-protein mannosyltransferase [Williamsia sterculiae]